jgi:hypothetical protein
MKVINFNKHIFSAFAVAFFLFIAFGSDDAPNTNEKPIETKKAIPILSEEEYLKYFQNKWDNVKLTNTSNGLPAYETYSNELDGVLQDILSVCEKDPKFTFKSKSKLNQLRLKLIDSKKNKKAMKDLIIYGQPSSKYDLIGCCEFYIKENANDPESIDIVASELTGQSKNGWLVKIKYRGKNAFGGIITLISTFDVRYNSLEKAYYVNNVW